MDLTHSNVIVNGDSDNLVRVCDGDNVLKRFWDTESIGIIDDSQDQTGEDPFLEGLQFKHCHFEVCLPWRNCGLAISDHFNLCLNQLHLGC